jgi:hypothetical protein
MAKSGGGLDHIKFSGDLRAYAFTEKNPIFVPVEVLTGWNLFSASRPMWLWMAGMRPI